MHEMIDFLFKFLLEQVYSRDRLWFQDQKFVLCGVYLGVRIGISRIAALAKSNKKGESSLGI